MHRRGHGPRAPYRALPVKSEERRPIVFAPDDILAHGYSMTHSRPRCGPGKDASGAFVKPDRRAPSEAWTYASVELQPADHLSVIAVDIGHPRSVSTLYIKVHLEKTIPAPNWIVERMGKGSAHAVWTLETPVYANKKRGGHAPRALYDRVWDWLTADLGGDPSYRGYISHNPSSTGIGPGLRTYWGRREPDTLAWMKDLMPDTPIAPTKQQDAGSCELFEAMLRWAGLYENRNIPALPGAIRYNEMHLAGRMKMTAVRSIARKIEEYREEWIEKGNMVTLSERQARRGYKSGKARRARAAKRDAEIAEAVWGGESMRSVSRRTGLSVSGVQKIVHRTLG